MTKRRSKKKESGFRAFLRRIGTIISFLIVGIAALIGVITGGLVEVDENTNPDTTQNTSPNIGNTRTLTFSQGYGAERDFWQVYFTAPTGSTDRRTYTGGVDTALVQAINGVQRTLDIAAFEWNNPALTNAVIDAHERGVRVRMVVDDEHALEDEDSTIEDVIDAGVRVVDDGRSGLMHNKFMIMDSTSVWTGSMNYTVNGTYRNNNNILMLRARRAVEAYQAEFNEMFDQRQFGSNRSAVNKAEFVQDGVPVEIIFAPEDRVLDEMVAELSQARERIRFMQFSFTEDVIGDVLLDRAAAGVAVEGIFEVRGSETQFSEMPRLICAGLDMRQDGNSFTFHHKVFIVDNQTVLTGSFNTSANATNGNDENMVIIKDPDIVALYIAEYDRMKTRATRPNRSEFSC
ncbi:MAG: phospholipase D-like domain-containing protein [Anaerolineae bacterium]